MRRARGPQTIETIDEAHYEPSTGAPQHSRSDWAGGAHGCVLAPSGDRVLF